jgi:hypothetical protein
MEVEREFVDDEFQESEFHNEEFEHEGVEDPSQGFVDWDSPPTYDDDVGDIDPNERPLSFNLEEEYEEDGSFLLSCLTDFTSKKMTHWKRKNPWMMSQNIMRRMKTSQVKCLIIVMKELGYVDFLGVDDILSDSHNSNCDEFYADEENYMFTRETTVDPFLSIFMARGREKE